MNEMLLRDVSGMCMSVIKFQGYTFAKKKQPNPNPLSLHPRGVYTLRCGWITLPDVHWEGCIPAWKQFTWSARLLAQTLAFKWCSFDNEQPLKFWENFPEPVAPQVADSATDTSHEATGSFVYTSFIPSRQFSSTVESSLGNPLSTVASISSFS